MARLISFVIFFTGFTSSSYALTVKEYPTSLPLFIGQSAKGPIHQANRINSIQDYQKTYGESNPKTQLQVQVEMFFSNGGQSLLVYRSASLTNADQSLNSKYISQIVNQVTANEMTQKFDLVIFTDLYSLKINTYVQFLKETLQKLDEAHVIAVFDLSKDISSANAAKNIIIQNNFYYTNLTLLFSQNINYGSTGAVLGALMRNDSLYGIQRALRTQALNLGGIKPARILSANEIKELQDLKVSAVINNGQNFILNHLWTANDGPEFTQQSAARVGYMVYKNIKFHISSNYRNSPNNALTWNQVSTDLNIYFQNLYDRSILFGVTSKQAYFVRADETVTLPADVQNHKMNIMYGLNILGNDFIIYKYSQTMAQ